MASKMDCKCVGNEVGVALWNYTHTTPTLLTLSACAEGYSNHYVCLSVCLSLAGSRRRHHYDTSNKHQCPANYVLFIHIPLTTSIQITNSKFMGRTSLISCSCQCWFTDSFLWHVVPFIACAWQTWWPTADLHRKNSKATLIFMYLSWCVLPLLYELWCCGLQYPISFQMLRLQ